MKFWKLATAATMLIASSSANAALIERLGGLAYYDDVADLTWLADANYAMTSGYDANGLMNWQAANDWAGQLTVGGVSGWRLPDYLNSEMGNLYNVLGNTTTPFINVQPAEYWLATEDAQYAWIFDMGNGAQYSDSKPMTFNAWAVQTGDVGVSAVPIPAAVWLFGSGLIGLVGLARRKTA